MCTLTIHQNRDSLTVTMNRDEKKERPGEIPPYKWPDSDFWAPQDKKANGTWFGVNEQGRVVCLLNGYVAKDVTNNGSSSRGELVPRILQSDDVNLELKQLEHSCEKYNSFRLFTIENGMLISCEWTGEEYNQNEEPLNEDYFYTSSSYEQDKVQLYRRERYNQWQKNGKSYECNLPQIHLHKNEENSAYGVLMDRPDACTKSITQYCVNNNQKVMRYWVDPHNDLTPTKEFVF
ncbi:MAG: NRDE family protein [Pseudomonadota bacterium]